MRTTATLDKKRLTTISSRKFEPPTTFRENTLARESLNFWGRSTIRPGGGLRWPTV